MCASNDPFDYGPLIKRDLLSQYEMYRNKTDTESIELAIDLKNALLQLPNHPILDINDVRRMQTTSAIMQRIGNLFQ